MVHFSKRTNQVYSRSKFSGDFVLASSSGKAALDNESVLVIGDWSDYTGSAVVNACNVVYGGVGNLLSPRAASEGNDFNGVDKRGFDIKTHRSRQHLEYIDDFHD